DCPIDALGELRIYGVGSIGQGVGRPFHGQPHAIEAGLANCLEVLGLERDAPRTFLGRLQRIAKLPAATQLSVRGVDSAIGSDIVGPSFGGGQERAENKQGGSHAVSPNHILPILTPADARRQRHSVFSLSCVQLLVSVELLKSASPASDTW